MMHHWLEDPQSGGARRVARVPVSEDFIRGALMMPEDARIVGVRWNVEDNTVAFYIEHDEFEPVRDGNVAPDVYPLYTVEAQECGHDEVSADWGNVHVEWADS